MKASFTTFAVAVSLFAIGSYGFPARPGEPNHVLPNTALNEASGYQLAPDQHIPAAGSPDTSVYDSAHSQSDYANLRNRHDANDVLTDTAHIWSRPSNRSSRSGSTHSNNYDHHRIRRGPQDAFDTTVTRMERMARVINGIALQQGLTNGTIPTDALISELLNLGSVTPAQIKDFNADTLKQLVKDVQDLPTTLKADDALMKFEDRLILLGEIVEKSKGSAHLKQPSSSYLDAVTAVKDAQMDWTDLKSLVTVSDLFLKAVENLNDPAKTTDGNEIRKMFIDVSYAMEMFNKVDISNYEKNLNAKTLRNPDETFSSLTNFIAGVEVFAAKTQELLFQPNTDPKMAAALGDQMKILGTVIRNINSNMPDILNLESTFLSRHHHRGNRNLVHSSGFFNGFSDIDLAFDDFKDPWVKQAVDDQTDALVKALDPLRNLAKGCRSVDVSIGSTKDKVWDAMRDIVHKLEKLSTVSYQFDVIPKTFVPILKSLVTDVLPDNKDAFIDLNKNIKKLSDNLKAMDEILKMASLLKKDKASQMDKLSGMVAIDPDVTKYISRLQPLKDSSEYKEIHEIVQPMAPHLVTLLTPPTIAESVENIVNNYAEVAKFVQGSTKFTDVLQKMENAADLKLVAGAVTAVRQHRTFSIASFDPIATSLDKVKSALTGLHKSIGGVKTHTSDVNSKLMNMTNVEKDSMIIGSATRVMRSIKKASEKTLALDAAMVKTVSDELAKLPDPEDQKNAKILTDLATKLDTFNKQVKAAKDSVKASESTNLTSLDFSTGKTVTGIDLDFAAIGRSVDKLNPSKEAQEIKTVLDSLDSLGLDFAKHHTKIEASKASLGAMDMFFAKFQKILAPPVPPTASPQGSNRVGTKTVTVVVEREKENGFMVFVKKHWMIGSGVTLLLVGAVIALIFFLCYWRNRRKPYILNWFIYSRFMGNVHFRTRAYRLKKNGMQYSDMMALTVYTTSLYDQDSGETKDDDVTKSVKQHIAWHNGQEIPLCEVGRLRIKASGGSPSYYHGNVIPFLNKSRLVACQSPTVGSKDPLAYNNQTQFWTAVSQQKSKLVIYLGKPGEKPENLFFPTQLNQTGKFGGKKEVTIKCTKIEETKGLIFKPTVEGKQPEVDRECIVKVRTLSVKGKKCSSNVRLAHVEDWPDMGLPKEEVCQALLELFDMAYMEKKPVFICCENGIGKTGVFTLALMNRQQLLDWHGKASQGSTLANLRHYRTNAVQNEKQYLLALCLMIMDAIKKVETDDEADKEKLSRMDSIKTSAKLIIQNSDTLDGQMTYCRDKEARMIRKQAVVEQALIDAAAQADKDQEKAAKDQDKAKDQKKAANAAPAKSTISQINKEPRINILEKGRMAYTMTKETVYEDDLKEDLKKCQEQMKADEERAKLLENNAKYKLLEEKKRREKYSDFVNYADATLSDYEDDDEVNKKDAEKLGKDLPVHASVEQMKPLLRIDPAETVPVSTKTRPSWG